MKRFIIFFVFAIVSLFTFAQVDSLYLFNTTYHSSKDCPRITNRGKKETISITDFKKSHFHQHFVCTKCISSFTKDSIKTVVRGEDFKFNSDSEYKNNELYKSGMYLEKSAKCQYGAIGFAAVGGFIASIPAWNSDMSEGGRKACFAVGGVLGLAAAVTEICAINFKWSAGTSLKISAAHVQYNF